MYDSAGETARQSVRGSACEQSASDSEFEFAGATSGEDFHRRVFQRAPLLAMIES